MAAAGDIACAPGSPVTATTCQQVKTSGIFAGNPAITAVLPLGDEQYETGLVQTVEAFLEADGNVAGTAQRLYTHRHTIRYRLERVKELSGLDVGSTDGREKLSLGLKAMRVLGIANRGGPATEAGAGGGRVPRRG